MATKNDKVILNLKQEIEAKKALLGKSSRFVPITNCSLELNNVRTNLNVASKETLLLLIATIKSMENGLKDLFPEEKLTISGYYSTEWLSDLTAKFNSLNLSLEKERLKKLEEKLHNLLSVDTKVELEIADLKGQI